MKNLFQHNTTISCRKNTLDLPSATFNRIVREDLRWHPFKIFVRHELEDEDFERRLRYARWFCNECQNPRFLYNVVVGDECSFGMNDEVSTQSVRMYAPRGQPPFFNFSVNYARDKDNEWACICGNGALLGPYFFDGNINGRAYLEMLNNFAFPRLAQSYNVNIENVQMHNL